MVCFARATVAVKGAIVAATADHPSRVLAVAQNDSNFPIAARVPSADDTAASHDSAIVAMALAALRSEVAEDPTFRVFMVFNMHGKGIG